MTYWRSRGLNRKQINKQLVQTKPLVEQVVSEIARQAEGRSVKVSIGEMPPVMGDAALLKQVFVNLIDNAFKYTRHSANATVEIGTCDVGGEQVFFVRDNGVGFDMNYAGQLVRGVPALALARRISRAPASASPSSSASSTATAAASGPTRR